MDLDELQSVQSRERQTDSLQQLRESFYAEASEFVQQLRDARDDAAERADDPWNDPEVSQLSDEIDTAEQTIEAIYDRRTGKIVKKASLAAAGMPSDEGGLTTEERALFESLVQQIEDNREHVLDKIAGELAPDSAPDGAALAETDTTTAAPADPEPATSETAPAESTDTEPPSPDGDETDTDVAAADLMGEGLDDSTPEPSDDTSAASPPPPPPGSLAEDTDPEASPPPDGSAAAPDPAADGGAPAATDDGSVQSPDRTIVRITDDVGPIYGVDDREYDLSQDDVVTLPEENAGPLIENGAAEQFD